MSGFSLFDKVAFRGLYKGVAQPVAAALRSLSDTAYLSRPEIEAIQENKLRHLLRRAAVGAKFYRSQIDGSLDLESGSLLSQLEYFPVLTKQTIRDNATDLLNPSHRIQNRSSTGGTTGKPLTIYKCKQGVAWGLAARERFLQSHGVNPTTSGIYIKGFERPSWKGRLRMKLLKKQILPAFGEIRNHAECLESLLASQQIRFLEGYPSSLVDYAFLLKSRPQGVEKIFTTGELLYPNQKQLLSERFNAKVHSYYGSNEINGIAFECECQRLHVCEEHVIVETLNAENRRVLDEPGRIVITDLDNYAMPFIRYEIGDEGILTRETCSCGRNHQILDKIIGRSQDYLQNKAGRRLPVTFFEGRFRNLKAIGRVQLHQKTTSEIELKYDGDGGLAEQEANLVVQEIVLNFGQETTVTAKHSIDFFRTERGKIPLIRSEIR